MRARVRDSAAAGTGDEPEPAADTPEGLEEPDGEAIEWPTARDAEGTGAATSTRKRVRFGPEVETVEFVVEETGARASSAAEGGERGAPTADPPARRPTRVEAPKPSTKSPGVTVLGPGDPRVRDEIPIRRGTIYGNPFVMRDEGERDAACDAYAELLTARASVATLARRHGRERVLPTHGPTARVSDFRRLEGMSRLAKRARNGEHLYLRCDCAPRRCHGDAIRAFVESRM